MAFEDVNGKTREVLGKLYLIIGFAGSGKSTLTRKLINHKNQLIFDVNNEYKLPFDNKLPQSRFIGDYDEFVEVSEKKKNTFVVFEDATGFFSGRVNTKTMRAIVKRRHQNNNYLFLFHSIHQVPKGLFLHANYLAIFKTNDIIEDVLKKFPKLEETFKRVNSDSYPKFKPVLIQLQ